MFCRAHGYWTLRNRGKCDTFETVDLHIETVHGTCIVAGKLQTISNHRQYVTRYFRWCISPMNLQNERKPIDSRYHWRV